MTKIQLSLICFIALNIFIFVNAQQPQYRGTPQRNAPLTAILKHPIELKCEYTGADGEGQFIDWYRDNETVSSEKPGHYVFKSTNKESILTIKIFVQADHEVKFWSVRTNKKGFEKPPACRFRQIMLNPSPQSMETENPTEKLDAPHASVRRDAGQKISFTCIILPARLEEQKSQKIKWQYSKDEHFTEDSVLPQDAIPASNTDNQIEIENVNKNHRGYYRCTLNDVSFTVLLRVKDRYAALWPFLGIVTVVLALVFVILIFEKRQKAARKAAALEDDDNDHTKDPLVRTVNRSSDNENKKRAIKT
ncbi:unnamed protein product [Adineta steineri]|uniref:Ig-like domain-containing protein n=1 Tax=Adineta steineri TaxID=433720 RepID=A0A818LT73_9BILA|nr:unnamed protein product [Adineta steineri]